MAMKFKEFIGNASTTASIDEKCVGRDVCVSVYRKSESCCVLQLESNGRKVRGVNNIEMSYDDFINWKADNADFLLVRGLALFGAETSFTQRSL